jgi:hypothetical protein
MMNDIQWRDFSEDSDNAWIMLDAYSDDLVLVQTEVAYRVDRAEYIEDNYKYGPYLRTANERVLRFAFIG